MSPSLVFRSKCHRSTFCLYRIWQLTFIASYLGNLTFPKVQTILFLNTLSQTNNLLPFSRKSVLLYFFNPVQFEYLPLTFKATLAKTRAAHRQLGIGSVSKKQIKTKIKAKQKQTNKQMTAVEMASRTVFSPGP